ncbi:histone-lysine N-methyltransferase ASHR2 [Trypanosoma grayi]|uniref:histone-lysine N-methyltransferase ASHR2 n=1 Tax=Trypanosoma grayi TaxID=71804 RepID=UPI0004F4767E|nr:histone-lysine N-methyltransferase ASHR2 [Trypanosoma grayi]KEG08286.1 histone-lysine N-methyltransferase ASHR2 [Trypanosoma grayi]
MASQATNVQYIDERRGRGLMAEVDFAPGDSILCVPCDIAVLYSPFVRNTCYRCFKRVAETREQQDVEQQQQRHEMTEELQYECAACRHLVLCHACVQAMVAELQRGAGEDVAAAKPPATAHELLQQHPVLQAHKLACGWFCSLPAAVREGDTDYLRFTLQYGARVLLGDTRLMLAVAELCTNEVQQSTEARSFCESFAQDVVKTFAPHGFQIDAKHLRDVLLRTKCNSIGYPFNEEETLGWALQEYMCMINHSCAPNASIVPSNRDASSWGSMELVARRPIKAEEEITIAYIDVDSYSDVRARRVRLLESYGFLCRCTKCSAASATQ